MLEIASYFFDRPRFLENGITELLRFQCSGSQI